ncbi:unnamed protein product [Mortierella alpina]
MMRSLQACLCALLSITLLSSTLTRSVQAHSTAWPAITRTEHILGLRHDVLPRSAPYESHRGQPLAKRKADERLTAQSGIISRHDTLRFQFSAFNTTFHLYLEPNTDLIHPEADLGADVSLDDIKAFKGVVIQDQQHSDRKWDRALTMSRMAKRTVEDMMYEEGVLGWARIMVEHDVSTPDEVVLRGAFMVHDDTYHITTRQHYQITKRAEDAEPASVPSGSNVVIYRSSDLYNPKLYSNQKRGLPSETSCGADTMLQRTADYNETQSAFGHYYPPDLAAPVPMMGGFDLSSSWAGVLRTPMVKRAVPGPNPVPAGCPINRMYNYMGVAADCAYVRNYAGVAGARRQIFADFNTASGIYESTFNVALGVIKLNIMSDSCPTTPVEGEKWNQDCSATYTIDQRLSDFSFWRGQDGRANDGAGLWHLMTKCNSGSTVGVAWTNVICNTETNSQNTGGQLQYTSGTGVSSVTPNEWMVVAHEIGHGFGARHDCDSSSCSVGGRDCCPLSSTVCDAGARYIMNPSEQVATRAFSPCSINSICTAIQSRGKCLQPPGSRQTQSSQENICGNGLKETGEDCDCGSPEECAKDPCCDGTTCKFKAGAVCDDMNDDCCLNCQLRSAGYVCRQAISECDIQEVCSGTSATCPPDVKVPDQTSCTGNSSISGLQCANGVCTSRDLQCQQQQRPGINKACSASNSCDLICNDPGGNALTCSQTPGSYFIDGTPCGFGGSCSGGQCKYSDGLKGVLNWARNHLSIVIPVGVLIGLILICCIWSCCCSGFLDRRRQRKMMRKPTSILLPNAARSRSMGPGGQAGGPDTMQGAQHAGQQYPMMPLPPLPPAPVYYDPTQQAQAREEEELQRALEASRLEHERHSMALAARSEPYQAPLPSGTSAPPLEPPASSYPAQPYSQPYPQPSPQPYPQTNPQPSPRPHSQPYQQQPPS